LIGEDDNGGVTITARHRQMDLATLEQIIRSTTNVVSNKGSLKVLRLVPLGVLPCETRLFSGVVAVETGMTMQRTPIRSESAPSDHRERGTYGVWNGRSDCGHLMAVKTRCKSADEVQ
jgi:hypothetical protein